MAGISTPSASTASATFSQRRIGARWSARIDAWKSRNARIECGKTDTAYPEAASSASTPTACITALPRAPRAPWPPPDRSRPPPHHFAQEPLRTEDQDEDQHGEGEDVLVLGAERPPRQERQVGGGERLEQAEDEASGHRAGDVADAAQHGRGEGLEAGSEARVGVDQTVLDAEEHAGRTAHRPPDEEGDRDHPVDVDAHEARRRSEEHTSELQSQSNLVCRLLLEKKKKKC